MKPTTGSENVYDVIILGGGIAGSMLACILARNGASVLVLEKGSHPKFAIGESTVPHFSLMMAIMSQRYQIPEFENLSYFYAVFRKVSASAGLKRHFGFVYHREGQRYDPREVIQLVLPDYPHGPESHLFRQDVDAYMFQVALRYGAVGRQNVTVTGVQLDDDGVRIEVGGGETLEGRFLVDATGHQSILAQTYGLREEPSRLATRSRAVFTHLADVKPYDDCIGGKKGNGFPRRWNQGTLHHLIPEGWMWVIPFDNHRGSRNRLCSIGLNLNLRLAPATGMSAAEEIEHYAKRYPELGRQLEGAVPVRDWVSTGRLQYSSHTTVGSRFCLLAHAAGFIDALYSRGLPNTAEIINALAPTLLGALEDGVFTRQRFEHVEDLQQKLLAYNDRLVHCSYISFRHFELWNAWYRIWMLGTFLGSLKKFKVIDAFMRTGDRSLFDLLDERRHPGSLCPELDGYDELFGAAATAVEEVEAGEADPERVADHVITLLREATFVPPAFGLDDPANHCVDFNLANLTKTYFWGRRKAPPEVHELLSFSPWVFLSQSLDYLKTRYLRGGRPG